MHGACLSLFHESICVGLPIRLHCAQVCSLCLIVGCSHVLLAALYPSYRQSDCEQAYQALLFVWKFVVCARAIFHSMYISQCLCIMHLQAFYALSYAVNVHT